MRKKLLTGSLKCINIIVICSVLAICWSKLSKKDDEYFEEVMEDIVETELMLPAGSIDFTPESKEL